MTDELDAFAAWAADLTLDDVPEDVRHRARLQVASAFAGARAGQTAEWLDADTTGTASVVGGETADPYTAAYTNAAASTVHDYDDYLFMGHTGHSAVFASLAACERAGLDGRAFVESVIVANELEGRLGAAVAVGPHNGQMWAIIHQAGAAAVAARAGGAAAVTAGAGDATAAAARAGATETRARGDADDIAEAVRLALYNPDFPLEAGFIDGESKA